MTPLDKTIKRALKIKGADFVITLTPDSLKLTEKGHRLGVELSWDSLVSGQSALAVALQASVGRFDSTEVSAKAGNAIPRVLASRPAKAKVAAGRSKPKRRRGR